MSVCFVTIILIPVKNIVSETKKEISPMDCKKKSEITLPLKPKILLIFTGSFVNKVKNQH